MYRKKSILSLALPRSVKKAYINHKLYIVNISTYAYMSIFNTRSLKIQVSNASTDPVQVESGNVSVMQLKASAFKLTLPVRWNIGKSYWDNSFSQMVSCPSTWRVNYINDFNYINELWSVSWWRNLRANNAETDDITWQWSNVVAGLSNNSDVALPQPVLEVPFWTLDNYATI